MTGCGGVGSWLGSCGLSYLEEGVVGILATYTGNSNADLVLVHATGGALRGVNFGVARYSRASISRTGKATHGCSIMFASLPFMGVFGSIASHNNRIVKVGGIVSRRRIRRGIGTSSLRGGFLGG